MPLSSVNQSNSLPRKTPSNISIADIYLDTTKNIAIRNSTSVKLTKKEAALLEYLIENANKILTRKQLLKRVWQVASDVQSRTLDVYIGYLRKKIDTDFPQKRIYSVRGLGYMLKTD